MSSMICINSSSWFADIISLKSEYVKSLRSLSVSLSTLQYLIIFSLDGNMPHDLNTFDIHETLSCKMSANSFFVNIKKIMPVIILSLFICIIWRKGEDVIITVILFDKSQKQTLKCKTRKKLETLKARPLNYELNQI